jgi:predicted KAP-like P-loop ATPase
VIDLDAKLDDENIKILLQKNYIDRNKYLNGIINILNKENKSKIIALDGEWGSGKTVFLKSLEYLMNKEIDFQINDIDMGNVKDVKNEYMTFYYNAWENDDSNSAMLSLIYKLVNDTCLEKEKGETGAIPRIINTVIKFVTNGTLDVKQDVFGEHWTNKQITDEIKTSEEIKETFKELINTLLVENKNKILIMIDEIDRCKPTFAIELLENIKHFYDDDRIIFIVATNNKQLGHSVCKVYGNNYDGYGYLDKFFDLNLELPNNYIEKYIDAIDDNKSSNEYRFISPRNIAKKYDLTMREYNRYLKSINDIYHYFNNHGITYYISVTVKFIIVPLTLMLKIKSKDEYYEFVRGNKFEYIESLIKTDEYFYKIGVNILKNKDLEEYKKIYSDTVSEEEKIKREKNMIISTIKEIYINIFSKNTLNNEDYEYKQNLEEILNIISMMN